MKKLLLATAIAASVATGAHAATTYDVSSNITGLQLWLGSNNLLTAEPGGYFSGVQFGGTAYDANDDGIIDNSNVTMTGEVGFTAAGKPIKLTFNLSGGNYAAGSGTTFSSGNVDVQLYTNLNTGYDPANDDFEWIPFSTIDASTTNLPFLAGQVGHLGTNSTAGLQLAPGTHALPGLWDGQDPGVGIDNAVAALTLLGNSSGMFLDGSTTLTAQAAPAVPVPAAAWLFGSAMAGLVGVGRKRKTQA